MKRIPCGLLFVLAISVLFAGAARAQSDVKIGFINSEIILQQYAGTKDAEATFRQDIENWNREARARKSETDRLSREVRPSQ